MGTTEIPVSYRHRCDRCQIERVTDTYEKPIGWQDAGEELIRMKQNYSQLLCTDCSTAARHLCENFWRNR